MAGSIYIINMRFGYFFDNLNRYKPLLIDSPMQPISTLSIILLSSAFAYSLLVSWLAYRQSGKQWMLYLPQWVDKSSGVSRPLRLHGLAAFTLFFIAIIVFFYEQS